MTRGCQIFRGIPGDRLYLWGRVDQEYQGFPGLLAHLFYLGYRPHPRVLYYRVRQKFRDLPFPPLRRTVHSVHGHLEVLRVREVLGCPTPLPLLEVPDPRGILVVLVLQGYQRHPEFRDQLRDP